MECLLSRLERKRRENMSTFLKMTKIGAQVFEFYGDSDMDQILKTIEDVGEGNRLLGGYNCVQERPCILVVTSDITRFIESVREKGIKVEP